VRLLLLAWIALWLAGPPAPAPAHELGVARASLEEMPDGRYLLEVETAADHNELFGAPALPERCTYDVASAPPASDAEVIRYRFACAGQPLAAGDVLLLPWPRQGAILAARWLDGGAVRRFFARTGDAIEVPLEQLGAGSGSATAAAGRYLGLGIEHILLGIDHLLFVFGLLLLVRGPWMLVKTVTAFTLAHSITLALATLGFVDVPAPPVEAAIALSIMFLAAEILHARRGRPGIAASKPWLVAFVFGLLHGLGFAGALTRLGLPPGEVPLALLFFNLGVEIGQLLFVALVLALGWALRELQVRWPRWAEPVPAYAIGTLAAFWFIERTSGLFAIT
jgi:hydrogenase/urease accessory protein HupE